MAESCGFCNAPSTLDPTPLFWGKSSTKNARPMNRRCVLLALHLYSVSQGGVGRGVNGTRSVGSIASSRGASARGDADETTNGTPRGVPQGNYAAAVRKSARGAGGAGSRVLVFNHEDSQRGGGGERPGRPPLLVGSRGVMFSPEGKIKVSRSEVLGIVRGGEVASFLPSNSNASRYLKGEGLVQVKSEITRP